jgi:hypothetical protein
MAHAAMMNGATWSGNCTATAHVTKMELTRNEAVGNMLIVGTVASAWHHGHVQLQLIIHSHG